MKTPMRSSKQIRNLVLALVMITSFTIPFIGSAVNLALPRISVDFGMNAINMSWVTMAYLLSSAVLLVPFGKLADIVGRKKIFFWGNIILALSSALCSISTSGTQLILFRVIQGVGSSMIFSTGMALVTSVFAPSERGKAIGLAVTATYVGLSTAPIIGGFLIAWFGWQSLFYVPIAIGLPSAIAIGAAVSQEWAEAKNEKFDLLGALVYVPSMSLFMYGFSQLPTLRAIIITLIGALGLVWFARIELRVQLPVLNVRLFKNNKIFAFSNLAALINYATTFAVTFSLSLYLQYIKGLDPRGAGTVMVVQPLVMALIAGWAGKLSDRIDPRILASSGMGVIATGLIFLVPINETTSITYLTIILVLLGLGFGLFSSPNTNAVMGSVDKQFLGLASGTLSTMRLTGQMVSMGIATLILQFYIGKDTINPTNYHKFIGSIGTTFVAFAILSAFGIWASLKRGKLNGNS